MLGVISAYATQCIVERVSPDDMHTAEALIYWDKLPGWAKDKLDDIVATALVDAFFENTNICMLARVPPHWG